MDQVRGGKTSLLSRSVLYWPTGICVSDYAGADLSSAIDWDITWGFKNAYFALFQVAPQQPGNWGWLWCRPACLFQPKLGLGCPSFTVQSYESLLSVTLYSMGLILKKCAYDCSLRQYAT